MLVTKVATVLADGRAGVEAGAGAGSGMRSSRGTGVLGVRSGRLGLRFLLRVLIHLDITAISLSFCSCNISCTTSIRVFFVVIAIVIVVVISSSIVAVFPIRCVPVSNSTGAGNGLLSSQVLEGQGDGVSFPVPSSELSACQVEFLLAHFDVDGLGVDLGLDSAVGEGVRLYVGVLNVSEYVDEVGVVSGTGKEVVEVYGETG